MKCTAAALFLTCLVTCAHAQTVDSSRPTTTEHLFQCGTAFVIIADLYRQTGATAKFEAYQSKFDTLASQAEDAFLATGKNKGDAEAYMQEHIDSVAAVAGNNANLMLSFVRLCDRRFP